MRGRATACLAGAATAPSGRLAASIGTPVQGVGLGALRTSPAAVAVSRRTVRSSLRTRPCGRTAATRAVARRSPPRQLAAESRARRRAISPRHEHSCGSPRSRRPQRPRIRRVLTTFRAASRRPERTQPLCGRDRPHSGDEAGVGVAGCRVAKASASRPQPSRAERRASSPSRRRRDRVDAAPSRVPCRLCTTRRSRLRAV